MRKIAEGVSDIVEGWKKDLIPQPRAQPTIAGVDGRWGGDRPRPATAHENEEQNHSGTEWGSSGSPDKTPLPELRPASGESFHLRPPPARLHPAERLFSSASAGPAAFSASRHDAAPPPSPTDHSDPYALRSSLLIYSSSLQAWHPGFVHERSADSVCVRFSVPATGEVKEKKLSVHSSCLRKVIDPPRSPGEALADYSVRVRPLLPAGFDVVESRSTPGKVTYLDEKTGLRFANLNLVYEHYFQHQHPPTSEATDARRDYGYGYGSMVPLAGGASTTIARAPSFGGYGSDIAAPGAAPPPLPPPGSPGGAAAGVGAMAVGAMANANALRTSGKKEEVDATLPTFVNGVGNQDAYLAACAVERGGGAPSELLLNQEKTAPASGATYQQLHVDPTERELASQRLLQKSLAKVQKNKQPDGASQSWGTNPFHGWNRDEVSGTAFPMATMRGPELDANRDVVATAPDVPAFTTAGQAVGNAGTTAAGTDVLQARPPPQALAVAGGGFPRPRPEMGFSSAAVAPPRDFSLPSFSANANVTPTAVVRNTTSIPDHDNIPCLYPADVPYGAHPGPERLIALAPM